MRVSKSLLITIMVIFCSLSCNIQANFQTSPKWASLVEKSMKAVCKVTILETISGVPVPQSRGTGFVISSDGYVLTNVHVVDEVLTLDKPVIQIEFENGDQYDAEAPILLPDLDVAILKVDGKFMPYLELEMKRTLKRGDHVIALGNPYPFEFASNAGIVTNLTTQFNYKNKFLWVASDAAVSPGMSGGCLLNEHGKVIAITQAYVPTMSEVYLFIPIKSLEEYINDFFKDAFGQ